MTTTAPSLAAQATIPTRSPLSIILSVLAIAFLAAFAIIQIAPFILTVANSFKCDAAVENRPMAFIPRLETISCRDAEGRFILPDQQVDGLFFSPSLDGYRGILVNQLPRWAFNTLFLSVVVTVLRVIFNSMAGYALARLRFPGKRVIFFVVLGVLMIPGVVLLIPRFLLLKELGLLNTYHGYIITLASDAFGILLMKQFFESIPGEIEEAAMVDGASRVVIFWRIVLPMATPALTALTIFSFQGNWNNFMDALIILGGNTELYNLPLGLTVLRGSGQDVQYDLVLAGSVVTTLPMALIFFFFQRYFVEGISYTGLKG
ncbi:MAG: carbohydrate ABC transporter permease [Anaerolineae bacterium]|nr:carbohydrate ABC transporter permease [Anaerolineae bacterium]MDW8171664.1 carbohydrate ABC transporter permease [Anaerolineae bacterium]